MNNKDLIKEGKTLIFKETEEKVIPEEGWEFWGKRTTPQEQVYVWRKAVTFEEAEKYNLFE